MSGVDINFLTPLVVNRAIFAFSERSEGSRDR